jgi:tRNA-dihydrouridine synthase
LTQQEKLSYFFKYLDYTKNYNISYSRIKEHAVWYTKGVIGGADIRRKIVMSKNIEELKNILNR